MVAIWMLYAALVALLAGVAAASLERLLRLWSRPVRAVWAVALLATVAVPATLAVLPLLRPAPEAAVVPGPLVPLGTLDAALGAESTALDRVRALLGGALGTAAGRIAPLDRGLAVAWGALSTLLALALLTSAIRLRRRRRGWQPTTVDGLPVLVAPDAGPAVMGSGTHRIVLPSWALALDVPLRALVLRHEAEHLRAGDPRLLLAGVLALVLMPWSPAVWWQVRRLRLAVELDCDRRVLGAGGDVERYGLLLLAMSQRGGGMLRLAMPALSEGATDLERRIAAMTAPRPRRRPARAAMLVAAAAAVVAAACAVPSPNTVAAPEAPAPAARVEGTEGAPPARLVDAAQTFFEFQVEEPVQPANDAGPTYPAALQAQGISGQVIAQFVVDTTGRADTSTFKVIESSHEMFSAAVRNALPRMQFTPARVGGRKVKQLVQQAFAFSAGASTAGAPAQLDPPAPSRRTMVAPRPAAAPAPARPDTGPKPQPIPAQALNSVTPAYPDALRPQRLSGGVTVMVVVDSTGQLEMRSFKVVRSDHPLFTEAVRAALPGLRYRPAMVGDRAVRQLVQLEFTFRID